MGVRSLRSRTSISVSSLLDISPSLLTTDGFAGYELLDSGLGRKLERFGDVIVDRPEPQALWDRTRRDVDWDNAHATFAGKDEEDKGRWRLNQDVPEMWPLPVGSATMLCRLASFRHMGLFPEQMPHWQWMEDKIRARKSQTSEPVRVLNLFAYTGAASLIAAKAGAEVTHVDASKQAINWAKDNQLQSDLKDAPIRWMLDDAAKFTAREVRRGRKYDIILVDPPKFGRGPKNETWDIFESVTPLLKDCAALLAEQHASLVLTVYAIRASSLAFAQLVDDVLADRAGQIEYGELAIAQRNGLRCVPTSLFVRWSGR